MDTKAMAKIRGPRFDAVSEDGGRALKELRLPPDAAILDVGTGNGNFAIYLAFRIRSAMPKYPKLAEMRRISTGQAFRR